MYLFVLIMTVFFLNMTVFFVTMTLRVLNKYSDLSYLKLDGIFPKLDWFEPLDTDLNLFQLSPISLFGPNQLKLFQMGSKQFKLAHTSSNWWKLV